MEATLTPGETTRQRIDAICAKHRTSWNLVYRRDRAWYNVNARVEIAKFLNEEKGWSLPRIGRFLSRDHSTVHHMLHKVSMKTRPLRMRRGSGPEPGASLPSTLVLVGGHREVE